jgi:hypothetical protein
MRSSADVLEYVPIDYMKAEVIGIDRAQLTDNCLLEFIPSLGKGSEIRYYYAYFRGLRIEMYESGRITIEGSLHKYANHGKHNHNDFRKSDFENVIRSLKMNLKIEPHHLHIICMEVGVNIVPPIETSQLLNNIFMFRGKDIEQRMSNDKAKYHGVECDKFEFKAYDKAKQFRLPGQLIRIEIKYSNWSSQRKAGLQTLADFISSNKSWFKDDLLRIWNELLFFDPTAQIPNRWGAYSNANFWRMKWKEVSRVAFHYHVKRLRGYNEKNGRNIQGVVSNLISEKLELCANT